MSDAERTRDMTDDEILADLRARRKPYNGPTYEAPGKFTRDEAFKMIVLVLATIGLVTVLTVLGNVLHG